MPQRPPTSNMYSDVMQVSRSQLIRSYMTLKILNNVNMYNNKLYAKLLFRVCFQSMFPVVTVPNNWISNSRIIWKTSLVIPTKKINSKLEVTSKLLFFTPLRTSIQLLMLIVMWKIYKFFICIVLKTLEHDIKFTKISSHHLKWTNYQRPNWCYILHTKNIAYYTYQTVVLTHPPPSIHVQWY